MLIKFDLRNKLPNLLTWRKEPRKQHEQKGLGTLLFADTHGTLFLRYIWVKHYSTGGQPLNKKPKCFSVCLFLLFFWKGYCIPTRMIFKFLSTVYWGPKSIYLNEIIRAKKMLHIQAKETKCSIFRFFSWGTYINWITCPKVLLLGKKPNAYWWANHRAFIIIEKVQRRGSLYAAY